MATELFANLPSTTVSSGGTDAPSGGTSESWTVASSTSFPAAVTGASQFHICDPAQPSEIMAVTNVSGSTWTVTRGAESTTPVTHSAGFTVKQVVTAGFLSGLSPLSGQYLCPPTSYAPGTQTALTTTSGTMSAVSSANVNTGAFSAPPSGDVVVTASLVADVGTGAAQAFGFGLAAHGTSGPMVCNSVIVKEQTATLPRSYTLPFPVSGLSPGTSYNFDLMYCSAGGGSLSVLAIGQAGTAPALTIGSNGAPVVMIVQAV